MKNKHHLLEVFKTANKLFVVRLSESPVLNRVIGILHVTGDATRNGPRLAHNRLAKIALGFDGTDTGGAAAFSDAMLPHVLVVAILMSVVAVAMVKVVVSWLLLEPAVPLAVGSGRGEPIVVTSIGRRSRADVLGRAVARVGGSQRGVVPVHAGAVRRPVDGRHAVGL